MASATGRGKQQKNSNKFPQQYKSNVNVLYSVHSEIFTRLFLQLNRNRIRMCGLNPFTCECANMMEFMLFEEQHCVEILGIRRNKILKEE